MKFNLCVVGALFVATAQLAAPAVTQVLDGSDVEAQLAEREGKIHKLTTDEQLRLRAAQVKAAEDPDVKAALEKRNKAIEEFRLAFRNSMIKADPKIGEILDKIATGTTPGF